MSKLSKQRKLSVKVSPIFEVYWFYFTNINQSESFFQFNIYYKETFIMYNYIMQREYIRSLVQSKPDINEV